MWKTSPQVPGRPEALTPKSKPVKIIKAGQKKVRKKPRKTPKFGLTRKCDSKTKKQRKKTKKRI
jgi:hypothetical protein